MTKKVLITSVLLVMSLILSGYATQVYNESDGLVIMEVEHTESSHGLWVEKTELSGFRETDISSLTEMIMKLEVSARHWSIISKLIRVALIYWIFIVRR